MELVTEYLDLLAKLHVLIEQGEDEGEEAEALRCRMDVLWYKMTPEEIAQVRRGKRKSD